MGLLLIVRLWASLSSLCERIPSGNAPGATQDAILPDRPRHAPDPVIRLPPYHFCIFHQEEVGRIYTKILRMHDQSEFQGLQCPAFAPGVPDPMATVGVWTRCARQSVQRVPGRMPGVRRTAPPENHVRPEWFRRSDCRRKDCVARAIGMTDQIDLSGD